MVLERSIQLVLALIRSVPGQLIPSQLFQIPFKVGDQVWLSGAVTGTYAQYALCNASHVHPLAASASFDDGGSAWVAYGTAYHAIYHQGEIKEILSRKPNPVVFIHGASGGVGIACLQVRYFTPEY